MGAKLSFDDGCTWPACGHKTEMNLRSDMSCSHSGGSGHASAWNPGIWIHSTGWIQNM